MAQLQLRDYQQAVVDSLFDAIRRKVRRNIIIAGTGAGKTEITTEIARVAIKTARFTFLVHRDALVRNTADRFRKYGLRPSIVAGNFPHDMDLENPLQVASIQTLERRPGVAEQICGEVLVFDETHTTIYSKFGQHWAKRAKYLIGLTATPWRLKKTESLINFYENSILAPLPRQLQEMGFLVPFRYFALEGEVDVSAVRRGSDGDFRTSDIALLTSTPDCIRSAVDNWIRLGKGRRTIGFACNVAHAHSITEEFQRRGIKAAMVHGQMDPLLERAPLYEALGRGSLEVLMSCKTLTEGFDVPAVNCVLDLAPTLSRALFIQKIGRGSRISPDTGKVDCLVLDQAGNTKRHGFLEDIDEFALKLRPPGEKAPQPAPTKECPDCKAILSMFLTECPNCGYKFPKKEAKEAVGELVEFVPGYVAEKGIPREIREYRRIKRDAFRSSVAPGFAYPKFRQKYANAPRNRTPKWELGAIFGPKPEKANYLQYFNYLDQILARQKDCRGNRVSWSPVTVISEFEMEFGVGSFAYAQEQGWFPCPYPRSFGDGKGDLLQLSSNSGTYR